MALSDDVSVAASVCWVQSVGACPWEVEIAADLCCSVGLQLEIGQLCLLVGFQGDAATGQVYHRGDAQLAA